MRSKSSAAWAVVQSIALSDFKQEIHSELMRLGQRAEHRGPAFTGDGQPLVFINGGRDDSAIVTHLCELFDNSDSAMPCRWRPVRPMRSSRTSKTI